MDASGHAVGSLHACTEDPLIRQPVSPMMAILLTRWGMAAGMDTPSTRALTAPAGIGALQATRLANADSVVSGAKRSRIGVDFRCPFLFVVFSTGHLVPPATIARATSPEGE